MKKARKPRRSSVTTPRIIALSLLFGAFFWIFDAFLDAFVFEQEPFLETLILEATPFETYTRLTVIVCFLAFGAVMSIVFARRKRVEATLEASDNRFRGLFASMHDLVFIVNQEGVFTEYYQPQHASLLYAPPEQFIGRGYEDLLPPEVAGQVSAAMEQVKNIGGVHSFDYSMEIGGAQRWFSANMSIFEGGGEGKSDSYVAVVRDITDRKLSELELILKDNALATSINAVAFADLEGKLTYVNSAFLRMWGYTDDNEVIGQSAAGFWDEAEQAGLVIEAILDKNDWMGDLVARKKDGTIFEAQLSAHLVRDEKGNPVTMMASFIDITERKKAERELVKAAIYDSLTGIFNRRHILERLEAEISAARRYSFPLSICLCDIDNFKSVNDDFGHAAGDEVLSTFGKIIIQELRSEDIAGRYGGDEFCLVFPHTESPKVEASLERVRNRLEKTNFGGGKTNFSATATFGVAEFVQEDKNGKELLEVADKALYQAKEQGRNRVFISER
ncbi:diguanylate cyclase [candidate division KSB1 bacterium]